MTNKIQLDNIASGYNLDAINLNFQKLEDELNNKVLYRLNPAGEANTVNQPLDMNGWPIINVGTIGSGPGDGTMAASSVSFVPPVGMTSLNVQNAIQEIHSEVVASGGVTSFNTRTGAVVLNNTDVTGALTYTPADAANVVTSFNTRKGAVTLTSTDVTTALGFTPSSGGVPTVANIAALRAATSAGKTESITAGYYTAGDGGGSRYWLDSTDSTSTDNGGSVIVASDGGRWKLPKSGEFSVRQFGAKGDSTISSPGTDDTAAIQAFVNYLQINGSTGYIPEGRYRCTTQITISNTCTLIGDGWKEIRDMTGPTTRDWSQSQVVGTILYADFTDAVAPALLYITGNSTTIRNIEFEAKQPLPGAGWVSNNTPYAISLFRPRYYEQGGNGVYLDTIMLRNFKDGIHANGVSTGDFSNILGQCFGTAIYCTRNYGSLRIQNVNLGGTVYSSQTDVINAYNANAVGIALGRTDNPVLHNIFQFGGNTGLRTLVDTSIEEGGATERLQATNIGFDNVKYGMDLSDAVTADISNFYVYNRNDTDSRGIYSHAILGGGYTPIRLNLSNGDFQGSMAEACRMEVPGNIQMSNLRIRNYNQSGGSFPGIAVYSGVALQYVNLVAETTSTTPVTFANGTGTISGGSGGGGGVTSFNTRTGVVSLTSADVTGALGFTPYRNTGGTLTGTIQVTNQVNPASGAGTEVTYSTTLGAGFVQAYDRTAAAYKDMNIAGLTLSFKSGSGGANQGSFDASGNFLLGYSTSIGAYKLQVSGDATISGAAYTATPATATTGTRVATCDYVINKIAAGGVTSFNTRTGAITLSSADVTSALGFTPANNSSLSSYALLSGATFSGLLDASATHRSTGQTNPGSGVGIEMYYSAGLASGIIQSYDRSGASYKDTTLAGSNVVFKSGSGGSTAASFDGNQSLLIGYGTTNGATYKLQVNSQIWATNSTITTSDQRLKTNVVDLGESTSKVLALRPVEFDFMRHPVHNLPTNRQVGFIAQEVESVLQDTTYTSCIVSTNEDGAENLKGLAESKIVPLLVKTIQELEARIRVLESK